jgi:hypothetical protein
MSKITRCMYVPLTSSSVFHLPYVLYMIADSDYDDKKLYGHSKKVLGIDLVCPVERYENTPKKRLELMLLSIGVGTDNLQPKEKDIDRAVIDGTYQISF